MISRYNKKVETKSSNSSPLKLPAMTNRNLYEFLYSVVQFTSGKSQKAKVTNLDVKESRAPLKQKEIGKIFLIKKVLNLNGSSGNCLHHLPSRYKVSLAHRKDPLRIQAICAAVQEGSLPVSALVDELRQDSSIDEVAVVFDDDDDNEGRKGSKDDENIKVQYHYTLFHMTFTLA
ncbi:hypothetical protein PPACK8108_LOCUS24348 [Phakopsora pachyrhizi]|uniref:Uncharacterized protein n=1 Tax=Phakopsora pachyrhizi TaxID=170000 RepID=A0AAV0BPM2_PHAPC|nr:hypothetical protein PPACK8108_LOCUS24348 [Phakopsora pachyrhizi]